MRIQHNIMAMNAYRNYTNNVSAMKKNLEKLSSGYKINRAGDDAAGLAISEKMRAQITGLQTAQKNAKDGISLVQTAEGALTEVHDMLNRMVELATQSANGTYDNDTDRYQMQKEVDQLLSEIDRIADSSNFNGIKLLDGSLGLNKEAVSAVKYLGAEGKITGADIIGVGVLASTDIHGSSAGVFQKPELTIDLSDVKITKGTATAANVTITIGTATLTAASVAFTGNTITATAIANALTTAYNGASAAKCIEIGTGSNAAFYKLSGNAGALKLELAGFKSSAGALVALAATGAGKNTDKFTQGMAAAFNDTFPGAAVKIEASDKDGKTITLDTGNKIIHGLTSFVKADSSVGADRWGADVALTTGLMKDGAELKIGVGTKTGDTRTFTVSISSTATKSKLDGNTVLISTKDAGTTASAQLKKFVQLLEGENAGVFKISGKGGDKLHIDVRATVAASKVKGWTKDTLKAAVSAKEKDIAEHNAGVEFNVAASKFTKGDVVKVGDKTFTFVGATGTASAAKGTFKDMDTLQKALVAAFDKDNISNVDNSDIVKVDGNKVTVYAATKDAAAPMVQGRGLTLQIGDTSESFNQLNVGVQDMHAVSLGISGLKIDNEVDAQAAIQKIKDAINTVSDVRGTLGATQNRLDHTINNLSVMTENIQDAESTIRDVDVAEEMMAYTKNNILIQSAQAMLAQANQVPQGVLQLLG